MVEYAYKENGVMKLKPVALSLSQVDIDEIATELLEAMQPDWQNAISLTAAQLQTGYTAPADGIICISGHPTVNERGYILVNGDIVASGYASSTGGYRECQVQIQVNKGDIVRTVDGSNNGQLWLLHSTPLLVPFKTSNPVSLRPLDPHKIDTAILNHWDDITSDFSTAGSAAGFVLDRAVYNPILRKLRVNYHITNSFAALTNKHFILTYNGSDLPAFTSNCMYSSCMSSVSASSVGFESSYTISSNKFDINIYNRNNSTAWAGSTCFTAQVEF